MQTHPALSSRYDPEDPAQVELCASRIVRKSKWSMRVCDQPGV